MTQRDKDIVRELAKRYMEYATDEKQQKMNERMLATNDLKIVRPPVLLDEIPWFEMDIDNELTCLCEDKRAQNAEWQMAESITSLIENGLISGDNAHFFQNLAPCALMRGLGKFKFSSDSYPFIFINVVLFLYTMEHKIGSIFFYITKCSVYHNSAFR